MNRRTPRASRTRRAIGLTTRSLIGGSTAVGAAAAAVSLVPTAYIAVLSAAGFRRVQPSAGPTPSPSTTFAILVPAHDEAGGIAATLESFRQLDYPAERFGVHVVADNCSDDTAAVVRSHGWNAHERIAPDKPGKGPALNWLYDRLAALGDEFDAVVIVDADTSVDPGFLRAMDRALCDGADVAQGFYSVRDPEASPATSFRFAALACRHHLRPQGRCALGASCGLYGNGMVFRRGVLADRRWSGHLVEDAELQNELVLDGQIVRYVADAVVRAEMPTSTGQATTQNERWERGRIELARRFVPEHLRRARRGSRIVHADAVLDHLTPPLSVLAGVQVLAAAVSLPGALTGRRVARSSLGVGAAGAAVLVGHVLLGLRSVGASRDHVRALVAAPGIIAWKIGLWIGVLRNDDVGWTRTRRNAEAASAGVSAGVSRGVS